MRKPEKRSSKLFFQLLIGLLIGAAFALIVMMGFPEQEQPSRARPLATSGGAVIQAQLQTGAMALEVGAQAPNFVLQDLNGLIFELADFKGNVILLNFWATWCGPCRLEMPMLEKQFQDFADQNFVILAINLEESFDEVQAYVEELGMTFPVLLDQDGSVSELYRIIGYPSSVLIDAAGKIQTIHIGILSETQLQDSLRSAGLQL